VSQQLALNIRLREGATFAAYYPGPNQAAAHALKTFADQPGGLRQAYLWGAPATGKSHLLQAVCHQASTLGQAGVYLPLAQLQKAAQAEVLEDLDAIDAVCIDDIDAIAGRPVWERALFNLINTVRDAGHRLVLASQCNPAGMRLGLADLKSRLLWGPVFHLKTLDDETKLAALKICAYQRGLRLKDDAARYLLNNWRRDMGALLEALETLDHASLAAQRRVTIPFIKTVLGL
jgi:DnaA family protein